MNIRDLAEVASTIVTRSRISQALGKTFGGARDFYEALGYKKVLDLDDYRSRYERGGIAGRIVDVKPEDTWRGGFELIEDPDVEKDTEFELAFTALDARLKVRSVMARADKLAGIGRYAIVWIGAPGRVDEPLESVTGPDDISYLQPYCEADAQIAQLDVDTESPRFGLPVFYNVKRTSKYSVGMNSATVTKKVHYTRVLHIADGLLDDSVYGTPRLERVWNLLDDLDKVTGGGAEAFWNRANAGMQVELDPTLKVSAEEKTKMREQVEAYRHKLERTLFTRGAEINQLGSDVADLKGPSEAIMQQICATIGVPMRVFMGSEQAKLAAEQDSVKYYRMIEARRADYAESQIVRPFVDRLITIKAMTEPKKPYLVGWSQVRTMDEDEKASLALKLAQVNATNVETVVTTDEIRELLGREPMEESTDDEGRRAARSRKGEQSWRGVHRAADRFPGRNEACRDLRLRSREGTTQ